MTREEREKIVRSFFGNVVSINIDRPIGYVHIKDNYSITYPVNYGYIPGTVGGDGEEQDVYLLGINEPVDKCCARIVGAVFRKNDNEDKLIAIPDYCDLDLDSICEAIRFQEQYFDSEVVLADIQKYDCTIKNGEIFQLPDNVLCRLKNIVMVDAGHERFKIYTAEGFNCLIEELHDIASPHKEMLLRSIYNNAIEIEDASGLACAIYHKYDREYQTLSPESILHSKIVVCGDLIDIVIINIDNLLMNGE